MKTGLSLTELAKEIERRSAAKEDFIAPASQIVVQLDAKQKPILRLGGNEYHDHAINKVAHDQLAEYAGIPRDYYRRMIEEEPGLLTQNLNTWLYRKGVDKDRRMVRTLDGSVRAVLSDKYRSLENEDLAEAILPVLLQRNLIIMSCDITDTRLYIKAVDRSIERNIPTGARMGDGSHHIFDCVSPAIIVSNSEVGHGALSIESGVWTKACTNMAVFGAKMRKYHTGSRAELSDQVYALLTDKTKRLTDAAIWAQTRDLVAAAFDEAKFDSLARDLADTAKERVEGDVVEVIERVGKRFDMTQGERKGVLASLIEGGDLSRYGVHSAITHFSAKVDDYDRATELERVGGKVIQLARSEWQALAEAA